jgi:transposase
VQGAGERQVLAELAQGSLRQKKADLALALEGMLLPHQVAMLELSLEEIKLLEAHVAHLEQMLAAQMDPLRPSIDLLRTIPGVSETAARIILSEIGIDMAQFGSAGRLASWVGICPGNNESAGKRRSGRTRKGNNHLRRVLVECAWATRATKSALGYKCRQLQSRIGYKKAVVAIGHKILVIAYHILNEGKPYDEERYGDLHQKQEERLLKSSVRTLEALGYSVNLERKAA